MIIRRFSQAAAVLIAILTPMFASAHEVYVLSTDQVGQALATPSFNMLTVAKQNSGQFLMWAAIGIVAVFLVLWVSTMPWVEQVFDPILEGFRKYAPFIARVTIGISFLAAAYFQASYGPELPLALNYGTFAPLVTGLLVAIGVMCILGLYVRLAAVVGIILYALSVWNHGWYMLTYINYLGELIVLLILGSHNFSLDNLLARGRKGTTAATTGLHKVQEFLALRSFAILRVLFGTALIYASTYAKIIHNDLALLTVQQYHLDKIMGFEPHFLVLGAAIVELAIGLFFILGIEIRFTALFFLFWLSLSLIFFGEAVWPHFMLIGIPIAYLSYGYDRYSVEGWLFRNKKRMPVL